MSVYNFQNATFKNGQKGIRVTKSDKGIKKGIYLGVDYIERLFKHLLTTNDSLNPKDIHMKIKTIDGNNYTIKKYGKSEMEEWKDEEYLENKTKAKPDTDNKWEDFVYADIYIRK